ncbi:MAG: phosphoribosylanthranilate isomerase [Chloroflexi bacterium]|nr:phosphoribosylanthranilate isomerase [Chloroflexota bacterium]
MRRGGKGSGRRGDGDELVSREIIVKICGIRTLEHALAAAEAGADLVGFVFAPSRRRISPEDALAICRELPRRVGRVGLFVVGENESPSTVAEIVGRCALDFAQLCGDEPREVCSALPVPAFKSIRVVGLASLAVLPEYRSHVTGFVLDGFAPGHYGGSGQTFDWSLARAAAAVDRILIAGGLTPENVGEAIVQARPWGVDVSSGVETDGQKDAAKIAAFVAAARRTGHA